MNLRSYLLLRMVSLGLICWIAFSGYVVWRTANEVTHALVSDADQLQQKVEYAFYVRRVNPETEGTPSLLGNQYGLLLGPYCLTYFGYNGEDAQSGCETVKSSVFHSTILKALELADEPELRDIRLWGQTFGELRVQADPRLVSKQFLDTLKDLLLMSTILIGSLSTLCYVALNRTFGGAKQLVSQLDAIALSEDSPLPAPLENLEPREFDQIAKGINRLNERLLELNLSRQQLSLKLLNVQEEERRELAHLIHADLGQQLSLIAVHCAQLRSYIKADDDAAREQLEEVDLAIENAFDSMRSVLVNKCPPVMQGANLGIAIQDLGTQWEITAGSGWKVKMHLDEKALEKLDEDRALCIYRTIEESLANIAKHGRPDKAVEITLQALEDRVELTVTNMPKRTPTEYPKGGMGQQLLAERVRVYGGVWKIRRADDLFAVSAYFPNGVLV